MARRRTNARGKVLDDMPQLEIRNTGDGPALVSTTSWRLQDLNGYRTINCKIALRGHNGTDGHRATPQFAPQAELQRSHWRVTIRRLLEDRGGKKIPAKAYDACVSWHLSDETSSQVAMAQFFFRGRCGGGGWADAIRDVGRFGGIVPAIRKIGAQVFTYDPRSENWAAWRPFQVRYPWVDPEEPNAKYSPFQYRGAYFDPETDGTVAMVYNATPEVVRDMTQRTKANAFLLGPRPEDGTYRLYHRDYLRSWDEISIDDWRARIVAGAGEDED